MAGMVGVPPGESIVLQTKTESVSRRALHHKASPSANSLGSTFNIYSECDLVSPLPPTPTLQCTASHHSSSLLQPQKSLPWSLCFHPGSPNSLISSQRAERLFSKFKSEHTDHLLSVASRSKVRTE